LKNNCQLHFLKPFKQSFMKKAWSTLLCGIMIATCFTQEPDFTLTKEDYLKKSRNQKTAAWVMALGGTTLAITGLVLIADDVASTFPPPPGTPPEPDDSHSNLGAVISLTGAAAVLGSIPVFIASGKNKRKAISISLRNERIPGRRPSNLAPQSVPTVNFSVRF
jgi:hypothetical protein